MFSYRHAFHAGNHADVLKHITLVATLKHLMHKEPGITLIDTHAGAGLYRLDGDYAETGAEAQFGILKLLQQLENHPTIPEALQDYLDVIAHFNPNGQAKIYPGSPFITHHLMRHASRDRLKLFEMHPTDAKTLASNVAQLDAGRAIMIAREDGFESLKKLLPPPPSSSGSRRAMVLIDPSYEIKSDYGKVTSTIQDCLKRFATGTYVVWYPIIARVEAHDVPKRLKTLANQAQKPWLHATLTIKSGKQSVVPSGLLDGAKPQRPGLPGSGVFIIQPPYTLKAQLQEALPQLVSLLGQDRSAAFTLESGG
jgi:23S rRNA (adenine2030-N6)-methyltransferase